MFTNLFLLSFKQKFQVDGKLMSSALPIAPATSALWMYGWDMLFCAWGVLLSLLAIPIAYCGILRLHCSHFPF